MSQIAPEFLIRSLQKLSNTQEDMQSLALFIRLNKKEHEIILDIYSRELEKSNVYHKLKLYYLANEILQTERDTDSDAISLVTGFRKCVIETFRFVKPTDDLKVNFEKLENVWLTRKIFELKELRGCETPQIPKKFGKEEFFARANKFFDAQEEFATYLKEFVEHINK